ncbi:type VI secretion system protein TssA [Caballeronia ptereochthonis]|uniref:ImpA-like protein n=1 Tax=Caballeronia ptereochthonis TaxID=1777144 RepID=A0A157ZZV2_9BURK|nr:type VI secretion system protein TssA [Caballeronia ptereochthonis]SAK51009.1 ImpA-like protein [Caballeronia ptereochthonis]
MIDVEPLLAPTETMPPAGVDLEYDPAFLAFEALARGNPERQFDALSEPTAWPDVLEEAQALLAKSKDLRIAVVYMRAAARVRGLAGFHAGLRLLTGLFERYWESLYPPLDADDDNDPALRVNALAPLADAYTPFAETETLLHDLRESEVCRARGERLTVRDILIAQGKLAATEGETPATPARVEGMLADALAQDRDVLAEGLDLPRAVQALADAMTDRLGAERAPLIEKMMNTARFVAAQFRAIAPAESARADEVAVPQAPSGPRVAARPGEIATREDAIALLDAVCAFLERTEPTHPAPLLIRRARGLMGKDFLSVMEDLAPDSLAQIHLIAGTKPQ